jgi:hypothetical protein
MSLRQSRDRSLRTEQESGHEYSIRTMQRVLSADWIF